MPLGTLFITLLDGNLNPNWSELPESTGPKDITYTPDNLLSPKILSGNSDQFNYLKISKAMKLHSFENIIFPMQNKRRQTLKKFS